MSDGIAAAPPADSPRAGTWRALRLASLALLGLAWGAALGHLLATSSGWLLPSEERLLATLLLVLTPVAAVLGLHRPRRLGRTVAATVIAGVVEGTLVAAVFVGVGLRGLPEGAALSSLAYGALGPVVGAVLALPSLPVALLVEGSSRRAAAGSRTLGLALTAVGALSSLLILGHDAWRAHGAAAADALRRSSASLHAMAASSPSPLPSALPSAASATGASGSAQGRAVLAAATPAHATTSSSEGREETSLAATLAPPEVAAVVVAVEHRLREHDAAGLDAALAGAEAHGQLAGVFSALVACGLYDPLLEALDGRFSDEKRHLEALGKARGDHGADELNHATIADIRARKDWSRFTYDVLIVPGYTPRDADRPLDVEDVEPARHRIERAVADLEDGLAPYVLVSGGSVHPSWTPTNEALSMRAALIARGVSPARILVEPHARHSTTNLRNAGRMMAELGLRRAVIVTGFDGSVFSQTFYFAHPRLSTFSNRSLRELGYLVGELDGRDDHHVSFTPAASVTQTNDHDPLDR